MAKKTKRNVKVIVEDKIPGWVTVDAAAQRIGVSEECIKKAAREKRIVGVKVRDRAWLINRSSLLRYYRQRRDCRGPGRHVDFPD